MSKECALWYYRYHSADYSLCDDVEEAIHLAVSMEEEEAASTSGVQLANGSLLPGETFSRLCNEEQARRAKENKEHWEALKNADAGRQKRTIRDPFDEQTLEVYDDEPDWIGVPAPDSPEGPAPK